MSLRPYLAARVLLPIAVGLASLDGAPRWLVGAAWADEAKGTAMVFVDPPEAEADVVRALGPGVRVVPSKKLADALAKKGGKGKLHATLGDAAKRQSLADDLRKMGLDADRVVVVSLKPAKGGGKELRVLSVSKSGPVGGAATVVVAPSDDRVAALQKALGVEPETASPPVAATAAPAPPPPSSASTAAPPPPARHDDAEAAAADAAPGAPDVTRSVIAVFAGLELSARRLSYTDALSSNVRPYSITGAPSPTLGVELYPLARTSIPVLRDLGLVASGTTAIGLRSKTPSGATTSTRYLRYQAALHYRIRLDTREHPAALGLEIGYSALQFRLSDVRSLTGADPSVDDRYLRFGADGRVPLGPVVLLARAGIGRLLGVGPMGDQFPRGRGGIVDGRLGVAVPFGGVVEGRLWLDHTRAFFDLRPLPGDAYVAGGAVDSYSTVHLDALVHF